MSLKKLKFVGICIGICPDAKVWVSRNFASDYLHGSEQMLSLVQLIGSMYELQAVSFMAEVPPMAAL